MADLEAGLQERYVIYDLDHNVVENAIVLKIDDPNSWHALLVWAYTVTKAGYRQLGEDVRGRVKTAMAKQGIAFEPWLTANVQALLDVKEY